MSLYYLIRDLTRAMTSRWSSLRLPLSREEIRNRVVGVICSDEEFESYYSGLKETYLSGRDTISGFDVARDKGFADGLTLREGVAVWKEEMELRVAVRQERKGQAPFSSQKT